MKGEKEKTQLKYKFLWLVFKNNTRVNKCTLVTFHRCWSKTDWWSRHGKRSMFSFSWGKRRLHFRDFHSFYSETTVTVCYSSVTSTVSPHHTAHVLQKIKFWTQRSLSWTRSVYRLILTNRWRRVKNGSIVSVTTGWDLRSDRQTCRPADLQTCRPSDLQTLRPADLQTFRPSDSDLRRLKIFQQQTHDVFCLSVSEWAAS